MSFDFTLDPFQHFEREFARASSLVPRDPNAMTIATVSADGFPSLRTVLFKGLVRGGLAFFTNYDSPKSQDLLRNPRIAALFFWANMEQQIRIDGLAKQLTREESEAYFRSRPRLSQIGAWSSDQSKEIPNSEYLQNKVKELEERFKDQEVPCPPHWGGWQILPLRFEFWYGRGGRLHERFKYERHSVEDAAWKTSMLSP